MAPDEAAFVRCPAGHVVAADSQFCPTCGAQIRFSAAEAAHAGEPTELRGAAGTVSSSRPRGPRALLALVLAALLVAGGLAAWRMTQKEDAAAVPTYSPPTAEEIAAGACIDDYVWAVNEVALYDDAGANAVMNAWGTADGRYMIAFDLFGEFSRYRSSYGQDAANDYVMQLITAQCDGSQVDND